MRDKYVKFRKDLKNWLDKNLRLGICPFNGCKERYFARCPKCGHIGHFKWYKEPGSLTFKRMAVRHAHFVIDNDVGRNIFCIVGKKAPIKPGELLTQYSLHPRHMPGELRDMFGDDFILP